MSDRDLENATHDTNEGTGDPVPVRRSLLSEFVEYLMENKKWWMIPIIVMVVLLGALLFFASTPAAPFIYTLF